MDDQPNEEAGACRRSALRFSTLVFIPTVVFVGADLFGGHLLLSGDNLIQSYPLRVLVGSDIRHGILPTFDPWIWSGTPLLAALNAGAFYPTTLLFAVTNPHVAWIIGEIFIFSSVGVGTCLLFSESGMSPFAAFLGAAVFAFGGAVATQASVHTDMAEGLASLPWVLLAIRRIAFDGRWRWSVLLGLSFRADRPRRCPRGHARHRLARSRLRRSALVNRAQKLEAPRHPRRGRRCPGDRAHRRFVGAGAALHRRVATWQRYGVVRLRLRVSPWSGLLTLIPYLEGGFGLFAQPSYFGRSNLGELGCYLGILPVIAVLSMWTRRWRARLPKGEQRCWYGILLVGIVLAVGSGTPLEHVLFQIPFYGKQRDSGRNIVDVDLAASALFAWWVDGGSRQISRPVAHGQGRRLVCLSPSSWAWGRGSRYRPQRCGACSTPTPIRRLRTQASARRSRSPTGLAAVAGMIALVRDRWGGRRWLVAVSAFALVDLALFACGSSYVFAQSAPASLDSGPVISLIKANLSPAGRYVFYDPYLFDPSELVAAGEPDIGILSGIKSFSGYGSSVDAAYSALTDTHLRGGLNQLALMQGVSSPRSGYRCS